MANKYSYDDNGDLRVTRVTASENEQIPVLAIRLRKDGEHTVVDAEIGGMWIEVIRERSDGEFCHIVEAAGMYALYYQPPTQ